MVLKFMLTPFLLILLLFGVLNNKLLRILQHKSHKTSNIELYKT